MCSIRLFRLLETGMAVVRYGRAERFWEAIKHFIQEFQQCRIGAPVEESCSYRIRQDSPGNLPVRQRNSGLKITHGPDLRFNYFAFWHPKFVH